MIFFIQMFETFPVVQKVRKLLMIYNSLCSNLSLQSLLGGPGPGYYRRSWWTQTCTFKLYPDQARISLGFSTSTKGLGGKKLTMNVDEVDKNHSSIWTLERMKWSKSSFFAQVRSWLVVEEVVYFFVAVTVWQCEIANIGPSCEILRCDPASQQQQPR